MFFRHQLLLLLASFLLTGCGGLSFFRSSDSGDRSSVEVDDRKISTESLNPELERTARELNRDPEQMDRFLKAYEQTVFQNTEGSSRVRNEQSFGKIPEQVDDRKANSFRLSDASDSDSDESTQFQNREVQQLSNSFPNSQKRNQIIRNSFERNNNAALEDRTVRILPESSFINSDSESFQNVLKHNFNQHEYDDSQSQTVASIPTDISLKERLVAEDYDWEEYITKAIDALEKEIQQLNQSSATETSDSSFSLDISTKNEKLDKQTRAEALLRLLYLVAGNHEQAVEPVDNLSQIEQKFLIHELESLWIYLDPEGSRDIHDRAALVLRELRSASGQLKQKSKLDVHSLAFCSKVEDFGIYTPFEKYEFKPGQKVLLYAEVDNFNVKESSDQEGYETELEGRYQIIDQSGEQVDLRSFQPQVELNRNPRRDYYLLYIIYMPRKIAPGDYTLQLTVEDKVSHRKLGDGLISFKILSKTAR